MMSQPVRKNYFKLLVQRWVGPLERASLIIGPTMSRPVRRSYSRLLFQIWVGPLERANLDDLSNDLDYLFVTGLSGNISFSSHDNGTRSGFRNIMCEKANVQNFASFSIPKQRNPSGTRGYISEQCGRWRETAGQVPAASHNIHRELSEKMFSLVR
jgi:hypothetical protein